MSTGIELSSGIVVDTEGGQAYVMAPAGGVTAVSLEDGSTLWHSDAAEKPLLLTEKLLIGQSVYDESGEGVTIRMLEVDKNGSVARESVVPLPGGVNPIIEPTANRGFHLSAESQGNDAVLRWEYHERPLQGLPSGPDELLPEEALPEELMLSFSSVRAPGAPDNAFMEEGVVASAPGAEETVIRGQVRLVLGNGTLQPMVEPFSTQELPSVPGFPGPRADAAPEVAEDTAAPLNPLVFRSADGAHRLESAPIVDGNPAWATYRWSLYKQGSSNLLGMVDLHVSFAPFVVTDDRLIVELQPYSHVEGDTLKEEPMQLRAYSLPSGERIWTTPVRDIYDVPVPPH